MKIQIKKSIKPVDYNKAMSFINKRLKDIRENKHKELIWLLEHKNVYTAGTSSTKDEIIDKKINIVKTNRGGKITFHGPGQIIFYFIINLNKRKKDIRWFLNCIERSIINTLKSYKINTYSDTTNDIEVLYEPNNYIIPIRYLFFSQIYGYNLIADISSLI